MAEGMEIDKKTPPGMGEFFYRRNCKSKIDLINYPSQVKLLVVRLSCCAYYVTPVGTA